MDEVTMGTVGFTTYGRIHNEYSRHYHYHLWKKLEWLQYVLPIYHLWKIIIKFYYGQLVSETQVPKCIN
jgi:hypothetical protein